MTTRWSASCAGNDSCRRRTWPNTEIRLSRILLWMLCCWVWLITDTFGTKSNQHIPRIRRKQDIWKDSSFCLSDFVRVQVSAPYSATETTRAFYSRSLVRRINLDCRHTLVSWPMTLEARPIRLNISGVERPHELMSLPKYVKRSVTSTVCHWMTTACGVIPQPAFWRRVLDHNVCVCSPSSISFLPCEGFHANAPVCGSQWHGSNEQRGYCSSGSAANRNIYFTFTATDRGPILELRGVTCHSNHTVLSATKHLSRMKQNKN